ncbi:MAG: tripartite tricarboxylate transporter substrate binding protein, partial [Acetobacteraceae bacterium]|nr:tripartite tricarboxylate transporter substrate binding protein [Acetobacteraceae bacterium]
MRPTRRLLLSALPAAALMSHAQAQSAFPDRAVRYIVPFPPG